MDEVTPERWRLVVGYPNYAVSNLARALSLPRRFVRGGILEPWPDKNGYLHVTVYRDGHARKPYLHRLVAEAFLGPCPAGMEVLHGPNGKLDNRAVHLHYGTHQQNVDDMRRDGTRRSGDSHQTSKLTMAIVGECRRRVAGMESAEKLASEFGVCGAVMVAAVTGKTWQDCPVPPVPGRRRGERHQDAKLTEVAIRECQSRNAAGETSQALAREFGVSRPSLYAALIGKTWKHLAL